MELRPLNIDYCLEPTLDEAKGNAKSAITILVVNILVLVQCASDLSVSVTPFVVHKCCSAEEILDDLFHCRHINDSNSEPWVPILTDERGRIKQLPDYQAVAGLPDCGPHQERPVFEYEGSSDKLVLMSNGLLRHYTHYEPPDELGDFPPPVTSSGEPNYYDHAPGTYCVDKALLIDKGLTKEAHAAVVCVPVVSTTWDADFVVRRVVNPLVHIIGIACLLAVAIIYFVLPPLRDLVGNILSTITVCLILSQAADLVRIFTEFSSHVSFMIADVVLYLSLLAAFFWLNSMGYYIWRTFRSRNVFLRVSDGRKYCYYSMYAWGATLVMTLFALVAHFLFDDGSGLPLTPPTDKQATIGWLGIAMFFTPIACTVLVDLFFYLTTARVITRMATYGRIHGRMKFSFEIFIQLFVVMTTAWLFLLLSWLQYDALVFAHMIINALQPPLILIICVLGRKSVRALLRKGCCRGDIEPHWGEEMMSMTSN